MTISSLGIRIGGSELFKPGELLSGYCNVTVTNGGAHLTRIVVKLQGVAKVSWFESCKVAGRGRLCTNLYTTWYINSLDLVYMQQDLVIENGFLSSGSHSLPFAFQLKPDLPSSFDGSFGKICYWISATTSSAPSFGIPKAITHFRVFKPLSKFYQNPQCPSSQSPPVESEDSTIISGCFLPTGRLSLKAKTDKSTYSSGDFVTISGFFDNKSKITAIPYVKLVQRQIIQASCQSKCHTVSWPLAPVDESTENQIGKGNKLAWSDGRRFLIPDVPPSTNCSILHVNYFVEVGITVGNVTKLNITLPIVIVERCCTNQLSHTDHKPAMLRNSFTDKVVTLSLPETSLYPTDNDDRLPTYSETMSAIKRTTKR